MFGTLPARLYADLVGAPFVAGGRGPEAYDCLGLVIELVHRQGCDVPEYASTADELARQHRAEEGVLGPCYKIDSPAAGCVVLMYDLAGEGAHLGVMVDRFRMIHAASYAGRVIVEVLGRSLFRNRVLGYYFPEPPTC